MKLKALLAAAVTVYALGGATGVYAHSIGTTGELTVLDPAYVVPEELKGTHSAAAIRAAMDHLIDRATQFDVDALETIYHKDFHTTLVMPDNTVKTYNKTEFIKHFRRQADEGKTQLNTWANWHDFHVLGDTAVSVLTRKHSGMNGTEMRLLCNIEWRYEDGRWQVVREQIFLRPLSAG